VRPTDERRGKGEGIRAIRIDQLMRMDRKEGRQKVERTIEGAYPAFSLSLMPELDRIISLIIILMESETSWTGRD
jgi:hypothetical protein